MHQIITTHNGIPLGATRDCLTGTPISIESESPIASIEIRDQPGGAPATVSTTEVVCHEQGDHSFLVRFADGHLGVLRLRAHN